MIKYKQRNKVLFMK